MAPGERHWDIYVKALGPGARPLRLTDDPANDVQPAWSPDGRQIALRRKTPGDDQRTIYTVPSLGGEERKLIDTRTLYPPFSWSPDGEWLVLREEPSADEPSRIVRLSLTTLEIQPLTSPPRGSGGDATPSLSPDGTQLAFARGGLGDCDIWVQPLQGGEGRRVTFGQYDQCWGPAWTSDSRELLFSMSRGPVSNILRVSLAGGDPQPLLGVGQNARDATVRGSRLVYVQRTNTSYDIWRVPAYLRQRRRWRRIPAADP